jgi:hypothetical protein
VSQGRAAVARLAHNQEVGSSNLSLATNLQEVGMPLKRKLIDVGHSRAVVIPAEWLKEKEDRTGKTIEHILLEINNVITIAVEEKESGKQP